MAIPTRDHFSAALTNVAMRGDTDIFPFPFENRIALDMNEPFSQLLEGTSNDFENFLNSHPIASHSALAPAGYTGFRWATQIDPYWNAYLLGLTLSIASEIEPSRLPEETNRVYSYRYAPDMPNLFAPDGWANFELRSRELSTRHKYVVQTDISDFYGRTYHHRLENALGDSCSGPAPKQIIKILTKLSDGASYGLPVGGPAARILAEATLDRVDRLLEASSASFEWCRYVDDYRIFVDDLASAHRAIGFLSEKLHANLGLSLQKSKTRILPMEEYRSIIDPDDPPEGSPAQFMRLHLHFDPYSESPMEDYERLRDQVSQFDILAMLRTELTKSQVHASLAKRLAKAVQYIDPKEQWYAISSFLDAGNLDKLAPVLPHVLMAIRDCMEKLAQDERAQVTARIRELIDEGHVCTSVELNVAFMVRILDADQGQAAERLLSDLFTIPHGFRGSPSPVIQRDIVMSMARRGATWWVRDQRTNYRSLHEWVQRAMIAASFSIGDEGDHWRRGVRRSLSPYEQLVLDWSAARVASHADGIPL